ILSPRTQEAHPAAVISRRAAQRSMSGAKTPDDPGREAFLARWSRRKLAPAEEREPDKGDAVAAAPAVAGEAPGQPVELPDLDTLDGLRSDYQAFMQPDVTDAARRGALKKLFSDPH